METSAKPSYSAEAFDEKEAARLSGLSVKFFQQKRSKGAVGSGPPGPPYFKIGRACRYPRREFLIWLDSHLVASTPEQRTSSRRGAA